MKLSIALLIIYSLFSCESSSVVDFDNKENKLKVSELLDNWHQSAANADYQNYFNAMDEQSIFFGTDAHENWTKQEFQSFSKPYFDKGKAWSFKAFERNIYFSESGNVAWFDELLETWMGTCVGSGVLEKSNDQWKIKQYILSVAVPNDDMKEVIEIKRENDSIFRAERDLK